MVVIILSHRSLVTMDRCAAEWISAMSDDLRINTIDIHGLTDTVNSTRVWRLCCMAVVTRRSASFTGISTVFRVGNVFQQMYVKHLQLTLHIEGLIKHVSQKTREIWHAVVSRSTDETRLKIFPH